MKGFRPRGLWSSLDNSGEDQLYRNMFPRKDHEPASCVSDAIDKIGFGPLQVRIGILVGLAQFSSALQAVSTTFLVYHLGDLLSMEVKDQGLLPTIVGSGMLIGGLVWGYLSDVYGRSGTFFTCIVLSAIGSFLSCIFSSYEILLVVRGLTALALGGIQPISYSIFVEFLPTQRRGFYLNFVEICWSFGAVFCCLIAWAMLPHYDWKWFMFVISLPMIATATLVSNIPETPHFQETSGDEQAANQTISLIATENSVDFLDVRELIERETTFEDFMLIDQYHTRFSRDKLWGRFNFDIFENHPGTNSVLLLFFLLSFGVGVFVWVPDILRHKDIDPLDIYKSLTIMYTFQIPGGIFTSFMLEPVGRPKTITLNILCAIFMTSLFGLSTSRSIITISIGFMQFFLAGAIGAANVFASEMYPTFLRSTALGITHSSWRLASALSPEIWAYFLENGVHFAVSMGCIALLLSAIMPILAHFDTSNKKLDD